MRENMSANKLGRVYLVSFFSFGLLVFYEDFITKQLPPLHSKISFMAYFRRVPSGRVPMLSGEISYTGRIIGDS